MTLPDARLVRQLALAALVLSALAGCRQQEQPPPHAAQPPLPATQPSATREAPSTQPTSRPQTQPATQPSPPPRSFRVTSLGVKADQPLSILDKTDIQQPARILASLESDHRLVIETTNVGFLRLDMLKLPREQTGRLILQIDGQGLEITGRAAKIVYLQRNSVGNWTFTKAPTTSRPAPQRH